VSVKYESILHDELRLMEKLKTYLRLYASDRCSKSEAGRPTSNALKSNTESHELPSAIGKKQSSMKVRLVRNDYIQQRLLLCN